MKVKSVTRNTGIVSFTSELMEVSDQRHALVALTLEKELPLIFEYENIWFR